MQAKHFWQSMHNLSKITEIINKKRLESSDRDNIAIQPKIEKKVILDIGRSREQNLIHLREVLLNKNLYELFAYIISDMYRHNFRTVSILDIDVHKHIYDENELDLLENVDLMEHSFDMFNRMHQYIIDGKMGYGQFVDYFFLIALAHDCGKSKVIQELYELSPEIGHHEKSALYLQERILDAGKRFTPGESETLRVVVNAIKEHHDDVLEIEVVPTELEENKDNELQTIILNCFKDVHTKQRKFELMN